MTDNEYIPTRELMKRNGLSTATVQLRMQRGWTFEDAISIPPIKRTRYEEPLTQLAKEHGIKYYTLMNRLKSGMTLEDALTRPVHRGKSKVLPNGYTITELSKQSGLARRTIYNRLKKGMTLEQAVSIPAMQGQEKFKGLEYVMESTNDEDKEEEE